jgi:hypothetical protein
LRSAQASQRRFQSVEESVLKQFFADCPISIPESATRRFHFPPAGGKSTVVFGAGASQQTAALRDHTDRCAAMTLDARAAIGGSPKDWSSRTRALGMCVAKEASFCG